MVLAVHSSTLCIYMTAPRLLLVREHTHVALNIPWWYPPHTVRQVENIRRHAVTAGESAERPAQRGRGGEQPKLHSRLRALSMAEAPTPAAVSAVQDSGVEVEMPGW